MQALRLARPRASLRPLTRSIAATANPSATGTSAPSSSASVIPLSNVEAQWERLTPDEQLAVHQQLEEIQKKDWKTLSIDEKKAAYYVAFGPHGPRAPIDPPGAGVKTFLGVIAGIAAAGVIFASTRFFGMPSELTNPV
ncbi:hypothetical protein AcW1_006140 [Taiwanofungus camphoratus]|nr:hypothetical protein AcW1_006140 [Antrodia cinnamomea]